MGFNSAFKGVTDVKETLPYRERSYICRHHRVQESRLKKKTLNYMPLGQEQIGLF